VQQPHEHLRELLRAARAESCQLVTTFLDIRGFSTFSSGAESFDSALYLRSAFDTVLSSHFADTAFFKLTGDGLLLIHELPPEAPRLPEFVSSILSRAVRLVDEFGQITADDYTINFPVPQRLGVGIARGSATRLISDGAVLDYTGRCLNLAARLMDKARPYGVAFADSHADQLMTSEVRELFHGDRVCVRGIAELDPMPIFITQSVEIAPSDREPIPEARHVWGQEKTLSVAEVRNSGFYSFYLPRAPRSYERVGVHAEYPLFDTAGRRKHSVSWLEIYGDHIEQPAGPVVCVDLKSLQDQIKTLPATTIGKILGWTKTTYVTFTPFCEPSADE
jgi:class 3 adenylate cyclase